MKILIIDDSRDFRALLRLYLNKELKDVEIIEYDFDKLGKPVENYDWSPYDILFLDYKLGPHEDGLEWLKEFRDKPGFPPTIVLTAEGDEYVAVKSIKLGAADYINKVDIKPKRIAEMVDEATEFSKRSNTSQEKELDDATRIIKKVIKTESVLDTSLNIGYKFVRMIGEGAMSKVYLAERVKDKMTLVLKVLDLTRVKVHEPKLIQRFIQEAKLISELNSPFVVKIFDHGLTEEYGYIAMEFFSRGDLKQRAELGLDHEIATIYATHIAYGLEQIHAINVVHRDLKPANLMFRGDDSLVLADFGISKKLDEINDITTMGKILGTPHYMSPEQGEGASVDARTDLYSLGVLYYELLTGKKPFSAATAAALIYQHVHAPIPTLPDELKQYQSIIDLLLAKKADDRMQTARELIIALEAFQ
ncbi:MAG TPA: response regulator [Thiotrichaceae bacterium]|jgi:serine/threonine-protein kinase PpkA|nr:response regulator [Thiotrichaceae bacterium]HIM07965.1 response regulator [Gammaproteobacteria bacterium]